MSSSHLYDVAIIGGGLAGLCLAIQCADAGHSVILFEKEEYPFHKVCGEYISLESKPFLQRLGLDFNALEAPYIQRLKISDTKGKEYAFPLPLGGFGVSRYTLDALLCNIATHTGVEVMTNTKVSDVQFQSDTFFVTANNLIVQSRVVAGTFGKRSNLDVKWDRAFIQEKKDKLNNYIGIKYHVKYDHPKDEIVLHNFLNGYCGMSSIEDDKSCLCYLTTAENLKLSSNSIPRLEENYLFKNPKLKEIFTNAKFLYAQPLAISQISFGKKSQVENQVLMIGDAAGMITPLCGNGMSMAMHGSKIAFGTIQKFLSGKINRAVMEKEYSRRWKDAFSNRLLIGRTVQRLFGAERPTALFLKSMHQLPWLARKVISSTHGQPF